MFNIFLPFFSFSNNPVLKPLLSGASKAGIRGRVGEPKKGKKALPTVEAATVTEKSYIRGH